MKGRLKKVLLISHNSLMSENGNSVSLRNLFAEFMPDRVFQVYFNNDWLRREESSNSVRVGLKWLILNIFFAGPHDGLRKKTRISSQVAGYRPVVPSNAKVALGLFRDLVYWSLFRLGKLLLKELGDFKPTSVFILAGGGRLAFTVGFRIARRLSIPVDVYITDNYFDFSRSRSVAKRFLGWYVRRTYKHYLPKCCRVFVISAELSEALERLNIYSGAELLVHSGDSGDCLPVAATPPARANIIVGYFGGLHFGRGEAICRFGDVLTRELPNAVVRVYTFSSTSAQFSGGVVFNPAVYGDHLRRAMLECDYLLHVESWDPEYLDDVRYSFSTKLPLYMASGRPIIGIGLVETASIGFLYRHRAGLLVSPEELSSGKLHPDVVIDLKSGGQEYANRARLIWQAKFSNDVVRASLRANLSPRQSEL